MLVKYYDYNISAIGATGWFLPTMFFTEIAFVIIANIFKIKPWTYIIYLAIAAIGFLTIVKYNIDLPLALDVLPFSLGLFAFGALFKKYIRSIPNNGRVAVLCILLLMFCYWLPIDGLLRTSSYPHGFLNWTCILFMTVTAVVVFKEVEVYILRMPFAGFIRDVGRNTLVIYLLHYNLLVRILPLEQWCFENVLLTTAIQFVVTLFIIIIMVWMAKLINKYLPWTLGRK